MGRTAPPLPKPGEPDRAYRLRVLRSRLDEQATQALVTLLGWLGFMLVCLIAFLR